MPEDLVREGPQIAALKPRGARYEVAVASFCPRLADRRQRLRASLHGRQAGGPSAWASHVSNLKPFRTARGSGSAKLGIEPASPYSILIIRTEAIIHGWRLDQGRRGA